MLSPMFMGFDLTLFPGLFSPHNGADFEGSNQLIRRLKAPRTQLRCNDRFKRFQFHRRISARVHLRRLHIGVSEPERNLSDIFGRL